MSAVLKPVREPDPAAVEYYLEVMHWADDMQLANLINDMFIFGYKPTDRDRRRALRAAGRITQRHLATIERAG